MTSPRPKRLTEKKARAVADTATLGKAPNWTTSHAWDVTADDGAVLVVVIPSYGGASHTGRNGWTYYLPALGPSGRRDRWSTRQAAAAQGLMAWIRWVTAAR